MLTTEEVIKECKDKYGIDVTEEELLEYRNLGLIDGIDIPKKLIEEKNE